MKAVPILIVTNALAFALALMAYLELDDLKTQRSNTRQVSTRESAEGNDHYEARFNDMRREIAELASQVGVVVPTPGEGAPASSSEGAPDLARPIDRSYPTPETFDETLERERPDFDYFRERVRLAQEENEREERIEQQIERLDTLITNNRIGALDDKQKKRAAEILLDTREKTRVIWRGLREREDLRSLSGDEAREAYRREFRKERDTIQTSAQKSLEELMPAADAETLMDSSGRDMGGGVPRPRGGRDRGR